MNKVLLMFSGGRDSFLSACRLVESGYHVCLIVYDNGCMSKLSWVEQSVDRIIRKYGEGRVSFAGVHNIAEYVYRFKQGYMNACLDESAVRYPKLLPAQVNCLACHTAMYLWSIAYCQENNIEYIADGARKSQGFVIELPDMIERYTKLCEDGGIKLLLPVYGLVSDWVRKLELVGRGFVPKTLEPQCWIGSPLRGDLSRECVDSLVRYYDDNIGLFG